MAQFEGAPRPEKEEWQRQVTSRHTTRINEKLYNVHKLMESAEELPIEEVTVSLFDEFRSEDGCWKDKKQKSIGPKQILELAEKNQNSFNAMLLSNIDWAEHTTRVRDADYTNYPLLVVNENYIVDGMHRLTKAWIDKAEKVFIKRFKDLPLSAEIKE